MFITDCCQNIWSPLYALFFSEAEDVSYAVTGHSKTLHVRK